MRWLLAHWELKLVSLVVALALWTYTSGQVRVEREVLVQLAADRVEGLPADAEVQAVEPYEFVAVLSVPTSKLGTLPGDVLRPVLQLPRQAGIDAGSADIPITGRVLGLDSDIRVVRTEPRDLRSIALRLAGIATATFATETPAVLGLPSGIAADVTLPRTRIEVRGPRQAVEALAAAGTAFSFRPVRIDGVDPALPAPREERIALESADPRLRPVEPVIATVVLRPARTASVVLRVPVAVLLAPADAGRWRVVGPAPMVEVRLTGPEAVVRALRDEDVTAWVDLHAGPPEAGRRELPVQVQTRPGITVEAPPVAIEFAGSP
jgi:hypothetical protein